MRKDMSHRGTRTIARAAAALALAAGAALTVGVTSAQAAPAGTEHGCPSGAVCIYPRDVGIDDAPPTHVFFSYGAHNLSNQFGHHIIFNNQRGAAKFRTCTGFNGTGDCQGFVGPGGIINKNLTPINSILLVPPPPKGRD